MLESVLTYSETGALNFWPVALCTLTALALGLTSAAFYSYKATATKSFTLTLAVLPALVQLVILMVNGNLGTGVAVLGAFGLVRFRSVPGSAREIAAVFLAMAIGLASGMGYLAFATAFTLSLCVIQLLLHLTRFGEHSEKSLVITIPENLDYSGLFDDIFKQFTRTVNLCSVRTAGMGSVYELHYQISLKNETQEKEMLDALRCRNGNLSIRCGHRPVPQTEL